MIVNHSCNINNLILSISHINKFMLLNAFLFFLICFHINRVSFEILVHRSISHNHYIVGKKLEHVFRFFLWLLSGLPFPGWTKHIIAMHRKHHLTADLKEDPTSPHHRKFFQMFDYKHKDPNRPYYVSEEDKKKYASDIEIYDDWLEINLYQKYTKLGLTILWIVYTLLFGIWGFIIGAIHRFLISEISILLSHYITHKVGFRYVNLGPVDKALIVFPIGIFLAGEELHANHHKCPGQLNLANRWFEFDIGYWYAKLFIGLGLLKIKQPI
jgi:stearoyl-CoA desaturase (delta-9 desaturase)